MMKAVSCVSILSTPQITQKPGNNIKGNYAGEQGQVHRALVFLVMQF